MKKLIILVLSLLIYGFSSLALAETCVMPSTGPNGLSAALNLNGATCYGSYNYKLVLGTFPPQTLTPGSILMANIQGQQVSCVVGQSCDALFDSNNGNFISLAYRVDRSLPIGSPLSYNTIPCQHLISCQKMLAGGMVWPMGAYDLNTLKTISARYTFPTVASYAVNDPNYQGLAWLSNTYAAVGLPASTVSIGVQSDGARGSLCRTTFFNTIGLYKGNYTVTGKLIGNACYFAHPYIQNQERSSGTFDVLLNTNPRFDWYAWNNGSGWDIGSGGALQATKLGAQYDLGSRFVAAIYACRADYQGGVVGGYMLNGSCRISYNGGTVVVAPKEVFGFK